MNEITRCVFLFMIVLWLAIIELFFIELKK